jgi:phosphotriesterase-related protein
VREVIRTVLGEVAPADAGIVDSHDHLFLSTPLLPGEELADTDDAMTETLDFARRGGRTLVQWTPRGLSRGLPALRSISETTGVHIVAATGRHRRGVYPSGAPEFDLTVGQLADTFIDDIGNNGCSLIKVGISYEEVTADEGDSLRAAAIAHHATNAPIAVHLERGSAADLVLGFLVAESVPMNSIVLGHLGKNPDPDRIAEAAQSGAWLCLDAPSPRNPVSIEDLSRTLGRLIDGGHSSQLLLGADTTTRSSSRPVRSAYGPAGLVDQVAPHLIRALGADALAGIMVGNPARAWSVRV